METNKELKGLISDFSLKQPDVANYTESSIDAVKSWCVSEGSPRFRNMPKSKLKLLKFSLKEKS